MKAVNRIKEFFSNLRTRRIWYAFVITFFIFMVLTPAVYVLSYAVSGWDALKFVLSDPETVSLIWNSLTVSFEIAALVTIIDILTGLPIAWILVRYKFRLMEVFDTLIDMPLAVPTSALGFSVCLFWARQRGLSSLFGLEGGVVSSAFLLILLVHVAFSYPYVVRTLVAAISQIDVTYEEAARTLGGPPLTVFRTVSMPLFKAGLLVGVVLAFSRSLSETGATMIALNILGSEEGTAPVLIATWRRMANENPALSDKLIPAGALVSIVLIIVACVIFILLKVLATRVRIPLKRAWPSTERLLSRGWPRKTRDIIASAFFILIVLIPSLFIFTQALYGSAGGSSSLLTMGEGESGLLGSLMESFKIAAAVTVINTLLGIPMAIVIARKSRRMSLLFETLVNVPLIVPTSALGLSLYMFWRSYGGALAITPFWLIVFAHLAFTYPYIVRPMAAAMEGLNPAYEEAARTLRAKPATVFRTIVLPLIKPAVLAGVIMAFTRSLSETGATMAVVPTAVTAPVYIVNLVGKEAYSEAAFACIVLILVSYLVMLAFRLMTVKVKVR